MKVEVPVKIGKMAGKHFLLHEETGKILSKGYSDRTDAIEALSRIVHSFLSKIGVSDFHKLPKDYQRRLHDMGMIEGDED